MGRFLFASVISFLLLLFLVSCSQTSDMAYLEITTSDKKEEVPEGIIGKEEEVLNVAFASVVSPKETKSKYQLLVNYLEEKLEMKLNVVQKQSYDEVNQLLKTGEVDVAFICSLSYVLGKEEGYLEGIAVPVVNGENIYRPYLIVHRNSKIKKLEDLEGKRFAYMDPYSYSGKLSMLDMLNQKGYEEEAFFDRTFYTYSHDYSVSAVARGAVDGAVVDSMLFDLLMNMKNEDAAQVKIIEKGSYAGAPPVVVSDQLDDSIQKEITEVMLNLNENKEGEKILDSIKIDSYAVFEEKNYLPIEEILQRIGGFE